MIPQRTSVSPAVLLWLGMLLFAVYLLSFSGRFHVMDELAVFAAGYNVASHSQADINPLIWTNHWTPNPPGVWGQDDQLYTKKAPGISWLVVPLIWLGLRWPGLNAVYVGLLLNSLITAATAVLLLRWLADLGFSRRIALLSALIYGLGTIAWVYARMFWESSLLAFFFLVAVWSAIRAVTSAAPVRTWPMVLLSGSAAAISLTLRFEAVVAVGLVGLFLLISSPGSTSTFRQRLLRLLLYAAPVMLVAVGLLAFNLVRFGSLSETGYSQELRFEAPWVGGYGLLFSPGRGLFLFSPLLLLLFFGVQPVWKRLPRAWFWLVAALCLFYWLFYGSWFAWGGTWGWGPRFLLPILPLIILYVAPPLAWAFESGRNSATVMGWEVPPKALQSGWAVRIIRVVIAFLAILSLTVNLLGITVDFNEHFLRLGRNDNFVFNWTTFPPLAHWRILREGLVDLVWLQSDAGGLEVQWLVLLPPLSILIVSLAGLAATLRRSNRQTAENGYGLEALLPLTVMVVSLPLVLAMMQAAAAVPRQGEQAQADTPLLEILATDAQPQDGLLVAMPPFGDVQEFSTFLMAYLRPAIPVWGWIETPPRAIEPAERQAVQQAVLNSNRHRVWLFERWHTFNTPDTPTAIWLNQNAFPLQSVWLEQSGRLTLYQLPPVLGPIPVPMPVSFQSGINLSSFTLFPPTTAAPVLALRLAWRIDPAETLQANGFPAEPVLVSVQLLDVDGQQSLAQQDRLLVDLRQVEQSPLLPGQARSQGYGLKLPPELPAGQYPLIISLYTAETGQRLRQTAPPNDDFVYLTTITIP
jgi:hypothetical protein